MAILKFKCENQKLKMLTAEDIYSGNINIDAVQFEFSEHWDGFLKTAVFFREGENAIQVLPNSNDLYEIPIEVNQTEGNVYVGVFGIKGEQRLTSEMVCLYLKKGVPTEGVHTDPTPDIYQQIVALCNEMVEVAQSVRDDADSGAFKGDKGDAPQKGVDYFTSKEIEEIENNASQIALQTANGVFNSIEMPWASEMVIPANIVVKPILLEGATAFGLGEGHDGKDNEWIFALEQGETAYDLTFSPNVYWGFGFAPTFDVNTITQCRLYYIGSKLCGEWTAVSE